MCVCRVPEKRVEASEGPLSLRNGALAEEQGVSQVGVKQSRTQREQDCLRGEAALLELSAGPPAPGLQTSPYLPGRVAQLETDGGAVHLDHSWGNTIGAPVSRQTEGVRRPEAGGELPTRR